MWVEQPNGNLFCLAKRQTVQLRVLLLQETMSSRRDYSKDILWMEGCPNLLCQRLAWFKTKSILQEVVTEFTRLREESLERTSKTNLGKLVNVDCSV